MEAQQVHHRSAILSIGTALPQLCVDQRAVGHWVAASLGNQPALSRWIRSIYAQSGIETRYTSVPGGLCPDSRYAPGHLLDNAPKTAERMELYERESVIIGTAAARAAIESLSNSTLRDPKEITDSITHLLVTSCTGFFAPGLDQMIARQIELHPTVERTLIGFMGCSAAFNALRLANHIVRGQPAARVLIVCVELCSIHIQPGQRKVDLVDAAIFCDGAAACIVGAPPSEQHDIFEIHSFHTSLTPENEANMVWQIRDYGFIMQLSPQVPENLAQVAPQALQELLGSSAPALHFWAIHPGGRAIIDRLEEVFDLTPEDVEPSRAVLRQYGNMSSPTILFVLGEIHERLRQKEATTRLDGVAMGFGPGLVTEMAHLVYVP